MWKSYYYEKENGEIPAYDYIRNRNTEDRAKIAAWIEKLEEVGPVLPRPYADLLEDGIHELRLKLSGDQVRILYYFCFKDFIIFTNAFTKNSDKVPKTEIKTAKKFRKDFYKRFNEETFKEKLSEIL